MDVVEAVFETLFYQHADGWPAAFWLAFGVLVGIAVSVVVAHVRSRSASRGAVVVSGGTPRGGVQPQ